MDAHTFNQQYLPSKDDRLSFMQQLRLFVIDSTGCLPAVLKALATSPRAITTPLTLDKIIITDPDPHCVSEADIILTTNEQFLNDARAVFSINSSVPVILLAEESDRDTKVRNANVFDVVPSKITSSRTHSSLASGDIPLVDTSRLEQALRHAAFFRHDMNALRLFFYDQVLMPEPFLQDAAMRRMLELCIAPSPELLQQERESFRRKDTGITERDKFINFPRRALYSQEDTGNEISSMTAAYLLTHRALRELLLFPDNTIYARIIAHLAQQHYTLPITPYARRVGFAMEFMKTKVLGEVAEHIAIDAGFSTKVGRAFFFEFLAKFGYIPFSSYVSTVQHRSRILEIRAELPLGRRKMQRVRYKIGDKSNIDREQSIINSMNEVLHHVTTYQGTLQPKDMKFPRFTLTLPEVLTSVPEQALRHIVNIPASGEVQQGRLVIKEVPGEPVIKYFMDAETAEMQSREQHTPLAETALTTPPVGQRTVYNYKRQRHVRNNIIDGIAQVNALAYAVSILHPELVRSVPQTLNEQKEAIKASIERKFIGNESSSREYPGFRGGLCELINDSWEVRSLREIILRTIDPVIGLYLRATMGICTDRSGRNMLIDGEFINHVDFETLQRRPWILDLANAAEQCFATYESSITDSAIDRFHAQLQQTLTAIARVLRRKNAFGLPQQTLRDLSDKHIQHHILPTIENMRQSYPAAAVLMDFAHFGTFMRYITTQPLTSNPIDHEINVYGASRVLVSAAAHLSHMHARANLSNPDRKSIAELTSTVQRIYDSHFAPIHTPQQFRQRKSL